MNLKEEGDFKNLQTSAFIAIGLDLFVGIGFVVICCLTVIKSKRNLEECEDELGPFKLRFGYFKIILTINIFIMAMPLIDTCTGNSK